MVACFIRFGFHFIPFRFRLLQDQRRVFRKNGLDLKEDSIKGVYFSFCRDVLPFFRRSQAFLKSYFSG